jgi:hypothetical protein
MRLGIERDDLFVIDDVSDIPKLAYVFEEVIRNFAGAKQRAHLAREKFLKRNNWGGFIDIFEAVFRSMHHRSRFF